MTNSRSMEITFPYSTTFFPATNTVLAGTGMMVPVDQTRKDNGVTIALDSQIGISGFQVIEVIDRDDQPIFHMNTGTLHNFARVVTRHSDDHGARANEKLGCRLKNGHGSCSWSNYRFKLARKVWRAPVQMSSDHS